MILRYRLCIRETLIKQLQFQSKSVRENMGHLTKLNHEHFCQGTVDIMIPVNSSIMNIQDYLTKRFN